MYDTLINILQRVTQDVEQATPESHLITLTIDEARELISHCLVVYINACEQAGIVEDDIVASLNDLGPAAARVYQRRLARRDVR